MTTSGRPDNDIFSGARGAQAAAMMQNVLSSQVPIGMGRPTRKRILEPLGDRTAETMYKAFREAMLDHAVKMIAEEKSKGVSPCVGKMDCNWQGLVEADWIKSKGKRTSVYFTSSTYEFFRSR